MLKSKLVVTSNTTFLGDAKLYFKQTKKDFLDECSKLFSSVLS